MGVIQKKKHKSVRLRLTPGTPLATVVSTGHIPMEPTCTHAPIAMETASFTSVSLRLRVSTEDFRVKTCFNFPKFSHKRVPLKNHSCPFSNYAKQTATLRNEKGFFVQHTKLPIGFLPLCSASLKYNSVMHVT